LSITPLLRILFLWDFSFAAGFNLKIDRLRDSGKVEIRHVGQVEAANLDLIRNAWDNIGSDAGENDIVAIGGDIWRTGRRRNNGYCRARGRSGACADKSGNPVLEVTDEDIRNVVGVVRHEVIGRA